MVDEEYDWRTARHGIMPDINDTKVTPLPLAAIREGYANWYLEDRWPYHGVDETKESIRSEAYAIFDSSIKNWLVRKLVAISD